MPVKECRRIHDLHAWQSLAKAPPRFTSTSRKRQEVQVETQYVRCLKVDCQLNELLIVRVPAILKSDKGSSRVFPNEAEPTNRDLDEFGGDFRELLDNPLIRQDDAVLINDRFAQERNEQPPFGGPADRGRRRRARHQTAKKSVRVKDDSKVRPWHSAPRSRRALMPEARPSHKLTQVIFAHPTLPETRLGRAI